MQNHSVLRFKTSELPRQEGEYARLRVLKGPDLGSSFVIKSSSIILGRGEGSHVMIADLKASRNHLKLEFTRSGWAVSDLGSANGIFFQGEYVRNFALKSGDHFTVGETILEFLTNQESNRVLSTPILQDDDLEKKDIALAQQKIRVRNLGKGVKVVPNPRMKKKNPALLIAVAVAAIGYTYPEEVRPYLMDFGLDFLADFLPAPPRKLAAKKQKDEKKDEPERSLSSYLPAEVNGEVARTAEQYYKQGFREYRLGNYVRARESFELALQVNPAHERARFYLANAIKENDSEIKRLIAQARRAKDIGRLKEAQGYFETAMRHMPQDANNPDYVECEDALKNIKAGGVL